MGAVLVGNDSVSVSVAMLRVCVFVCVSRSGGSRGCISSGAICVCNSGRVFSKRHERGCSAGGAAINKGNGRNKKGDAELESKCVER